MGRGDGHVMLGWVLASVILPPVATVREPERLENDFVHRDDMHGGIVQALSKGGFYDCGGFPFFLIA